MSLCLAARGEDGYDLWLRYKKLDDAATLTAFRGQLSSVYSGKTSATLLAASLELTKGLSTLLGTQVSVTNAIAKGSVVLHSGNLEQRVGLPVKPGQLGEEGFVIFTEPNANRNIVIAANTDIGVLYGAFALLRIIQTQQSIPAVTISIPKIKTRMLNHWDNLNRTVERGYSGLSIWNWHTLPGYIDERYVDYARANASIGINAAALTNVNANALMLTPAYLQKVKALANVFRPYGIKVYLTARFSAPIEIGALKTADPLDENVRQWWASKAKQIYDSIPDFGGFLVKANSEGQPGPQNYDRTHADGANMLADAVAPFGGLVIWRAFVYDIRVQKSSESFDSANDASVENIASTDRFKQAYAEFKPLDGKFRKNVMVQVKNGPIDFQPREPFSPLFGAMPQTPLAMEFQVTHEYLGQGTHLVYDGPLFKETLGSETYANNQPNTVAQVVDGSAHHYTHTAMAGVANVGNERNWTTNPFLQANWYVFGRLAWDHTLSAEEIAKEWTAQTFTYNRTAQHRIVDLMMKSREAAVNYMTPLGLHHIMATGHHYGPGPWVSNLGRADWNPVYYHKADAYGIGFNRTATGSNALAQYHPRVQQQWADSNTCNEKYLLWFHHVSWNHKMESGNTLWDELCHKYQEGVDTVRAMQNQWHTLKPYVDAERFKQVAMFLQVQESDAEWWRDACLSYFQSFSGQKIPTGVEKPTHSLDHYKSLRFPFAPGIGGNN